MAPVNFGKKLNKKTQKSRLGGQIFQMEGV